MDPDGAVPPRPEHGLITLEWLLIVAAIAGIAATSVLIVQRVVDDATDVPPDPVTRMIDADIAAAVVAADAQAAYDDFLDGGPSYDDAVDAVFDGQCRDLSPDPESRFGDVVVSAHRLDPDLSGVNRILGDHDDLEPPQWHDPRGSDPADTADDVGARCVLTPRPNLGG